MYLWQVKNKTKHDLDEPDQTQYGWYVSSKSCNAYYLHTDGEVKYGADEDENNSKGYFKSYAEALETKRKYESN